MYSRIWGALAGLPMMIVSTRASAMPPVIGINSDTDAVTRNFKGPEQRIHEYRVDSEGKLYWRVEGTAAWSLFEKQPLDDSGQPMRIVNLAADNNRLFVLAEHLDAARNVIGHQLLWFCVYEDTAPRVTKILNQVLPAGDLGSGSLTGSKHSSTLPSTKKPIAIG